MKIIIILSLLLISTNSWALLDDNSTSQEQDQKQSQLQDQSQKQNADATSISRGGNAVQSQGQAQGNDQSIVTNNEGDKFTSSVWPITPSTPSKEEKSIYTLFGGLGSNKTEEQQRLITQMQITEKLHKDGIIDAETYKITMMKDYFQLRSSNKGQKLLGFIPVAERGCNLLNLCGLANW